MVNLISIIRIISSINSVLIQFDQETLTGLREFAEAFHKYVNYFEKLLPYHVLRYVNPIHVCMLSLDLLSIDIFSIARSVLQAFSQLVLIRKSK